MSKYNSGSLSAEQYELFTTFANSLNKEQLSWVSGYLSGLSASKSTQFTLAEENSASSISTVVTSVSADPLTILYGSRTGNGEGLAELALKMATERGIKATLKNMGEYKTRDLSTEKNLLIIVSTHGDGVPPFTAKELHEFIFGKRAPKLEGVNYAVLGLGDSSYFQFCKTGKDFDEQLEKLGAKRVVPAISCDVDFDDAADIWLKDTLLAFSGGEVVAENKASETVSKEQPFKKLIPSRKLRSEQLPISKKNPFSAPVFEKVQLHGKGSDRQTIHMELSLEDSALAYLPGDAAGVIPVNPSVLIDEVLKVTALKSDDIVEVAGEKKSLYDALYRNVELSKITTDVVSRFLAFAPNEKLLTISKNHEEFKAYLEGRDIVDLFQDFPVKITAQELIKLLKPLQPRYYSISSSPDACPGELHLTVGVVNYKNAGRFKQGTCSTFLSEVLVEDEHVPIFIESNPGFRLPEEAQTPIIMIGAGTGIAPYRAFVQHREISENAGKSWLFFGNRNFESEFLYQTEWHKFLKSGALTKMDVAFSRDGDKKEYVQDRLLQNAEEVYNWLEEGAHVYICGDMNKMANDVQNALVQIVEEQGSLTAEGAQEYVDNLQKAKRLQLDVY
jgi:sulfite reductase (NADPH) flavoprotein alpha-component